jgi:hypothetical protein
LQWFPDFIRSTAFHPVFLSSADTSKRVFTGSATVTDVGNAGGVRSPF